MNATGGPAGMASFLLVLLAGCGQKLPPPPASAPPYAPFTRSAEYQRPAWLPNGEELLFSGGPPGDFRIYRIPTKGGKAAQLFPQTDCGHASVHGPTARLAYSALGSHGTWCLWIANLDGSARRQVTQGGIDLFPSWSPDGTQLVFRSARDGIIRTVSVDGRALRSLGTSLSAPAWSPDGRWIAFARGDAEAGRAEVVLVSLADASQRVLRSTLATNLPTSVLLEGELHVDWSPDGRQLVCPRWVQGRMELALVEADADRVISRLPTAGDARSPAWSPDGKRIAYVSQTTSHRGAIRVISADGSGDAPVTDPEALVEGQWIEYPSKDGLRIPSCLYRPAGPRTEKCAAIVWLHGGGVSGAALESFDPSIQYFVANGFVVLAPNYRISRGFDPRLARASSGQDIADDVAAAVDYLRTLDAVDPKRIGVYGASFGGLGVLLAVTRHPDLFAAAVEFNGPCDLAALYRQVPIYRPAVRAVLGGSPDERADAYRAESPLTSVGQIRAPLLVIHGTADETVPFGQALVLVEALKRAGKPHKFVAYRGVGHGFSGPVWENAIQHALVFFQEHLQAAGG
jgi:dipeptidyl aminopeptidase/acylaminoacyl peptidase